MEDQMEDHILCQSWVLKSKNFRCLFIKKFQLVTGILNIIVFIKFNDDQGMLFLKTNGKKCIGILCIVYFKFVVVDFPALSLSTEYNLTAEELSDYADVLNTGML